MLSLQHSELPVSAHADVRVLWYQPAKKLRTADQLTTCRIAFAAWAQPGLYCICIEW